jgi:hypothetical protein
MRCPICLHELPEDDLRCPYCSASVDRDEPSEGDGGEKGGDIIWKIIRTVSTDVEVHLIAGQLRSFGVPAFVLSQVDSTRGLTVGALAVAKVFVPEAMMAEAESILAAPPGDMGEEAAPEPEDIPDIDRPSAPAPGEDPSHRLGR